MGLDTQPGTEIIATTIIQFWTCAVQMKRRVPNAGGPQPTREYAVVPRRSRCLLGDMRAPCAHVAA